MNEFQELSLAGPLRTAIASAGFHTPTPIQKLAIPPAIEGRDLLACAQTGSGKTVAFALPLLQRFAETPARRPSGAPRALIVAPTRELAAQIGDVFSELGRGLGLRYAVIFGGVGKQPQIAVLRKGVDILVATPGRLLDLMSERHVVLTQVEAVVLDEADRMLDMGFLPDVRRIIKALPTHRQSLFFSATMPPDVASLAKDMLDNPLHVEIPQDASTTPNIDQTLRFVARENKKTALRDLLNGIGATRTLVFTRTKHRANNIAKYLSREGFHSDSIHGDKSQGARQRALAGFHSGKVKVLVATDIASRGIHVDDIEHVVNFELPYEPEVYVHRIGRTARAGKDGAAFSFCDDSEVSQLTAIEKFINAKLPIDINHSHHSPETAAMHADLVERQSRGRSGGNRGGGRPGGGGHRSSQGRARRHPAQRHHHPRARARNGG